jgi:hypothetical protein
MSVVRVVNPCHVYILRGEALPPQGLGLILSVEIYSSSVSSRTSSRIPAVWAASVILRISVRVNGRLSSMTIRRAALWSPVRMVARIPVMSPIVIRSLERDERDGLFPPRLR